MKTIIIVIALIIVAVVIYAAFAKKTNETTVTGATETHGSALGFLDGILNGLHLSVA